MADNVKESPIVAKTFSLDDVPVVKDFIDFEIRYEESRLRAWKAKTYWFNNPAYPGEFKKRIKALEKVREIVGELAGAKEAIENVKKYGFTGRPDDDTGEVRES